MPTISATQRVTFGSRGAFITWTGLATGDDGSAAETVDMADRSVQVTGTFGGASVSLQGSNDGATWFVLNDPLGAALTFTSAGLRQVLEITRYVRPVVSGGAGSGLIVSLVALGTGR